MEIEAPAKINLSLVIQGKRDDGFHNIKTIFQTISLFDKIKIFPSPALSVSCQGIPEKENLVYKAAISLLEYANCKKGAKIVIKKHIPISAGMGGGSSNCAECLLALNRFWNLSLSLNELKKIGENLGSDVCFFLEKGTGLGEGRGEKITRLSLIPNCFFLLIFFSFKVSTREVYQKVRSQKTKERIEKMLLAIKNGDIFGIAKNLHNCLESVTIRKYPEIGRMKEYLIKEGALNALMSGSGPTVFGIFNKRKDIERIRKNLALSGIKAKVVKPI
ncbi:MAG: 4-(cytidine 5'-diphospho)-2-C-methyl-D-erythritol kinase [bacterium]